MNNTNVVCQLLECLKNIISDQTELWLEKCKFIHDNIDKVLNECQVEHCYINGVLFINSSGICDEKLLLLFKCFRKLSSVINHPNNQLYLRFIPKISKTLNSFDKIKPDTETGSHMPLSNMQGFFNDLILSRDQSKIRVICLLNDRGYKAKYFHTFEYKIDQISEIERRYDSLISIYKNWCLYHAYNSSYVVDRLLIGSLTLLSNKVVDVFSDEEECYGAIMCCLTLIDKYIIIVNEKDSIDKITYLLLTCLELIALYFCKHSGKDKMRTAECHVNRARLIDRFTYKGHDQLMFALGTLMYSKYEPFDPLILKALYIYDMDSASYLMPVEFEENYDYRMSANMMHQNRQVTMVLPEGGDVFETNYFDMVRLGEKHALSMMYYSMENYNSIIGTIAYSFKNIKKCLKAIYRNLPYQKENIICISYSHQLESYSRYGKVEPVFIPIRFGVKKLLESIHYSGKLNKTNNETAVIYRLENLNLCPESRHDETYDLMRSPLISQLILVADKDDNLLSINCYGMHLWALKHRLSWDKVFYGIPVRVIDYQLNQFPESLTLYVCFQSENDIN